MFVDQNGSLKRGEFMNDCPPITQKATYSNLPRPRTIKLAPINIKVAKVM